MYVTLTRLPMFPLWPNQTCNSSMSWPRQGVNSIDLLDLQLILFVDPFTINMKPKRTTVKTITVNHIS